MSRFYFNLVILMWGELVGCCSTSYSARDGPQHLIVQDGPPIITKSYLTPDFNSATDQCHSSFNQTNLCTGVYVTLLFFDPF